MFHVKQDNWKKNDLIKNAIDAGYDANILDNVEREARPSAEFYVLKLTESGVEAAKNSGIVQTIREQWYDFQKTRTDTTYTPAHSEPSASIPQQEFLWEILGMDKLEFPVIVLNVDDGADFMDFAKDYFTEDADSTETDTYQRDFVWTTWLQAKTAGFAYSLTKSADFPTEANPPYLEWLNSTKMDYSDDSPCLIIFTRKVIWGGSVYFHEPDEWATISAGSEPLVKVGTIKDFHLTDPRAQAILDNKGGRYDDGWISIDLPKATKGDTGDTGPQGPQGEKGDKGDTGATGATGPKGDKGDTGDTGAPGQDGKDGATKYPPGGRPGSGDSTGGYPPSGPQDGFGGIVDTDCNTVTIFSATGTNGSETFASFLGVSIPGWLTTAIIGAPLPDVFKQEYNQDIKSSIDAAIAATGLLPTGGIVTAVTLCYHWIGTTKFSISVFGIESFISKIATIPKLTAAKSNGSTMLHYNLTNDQVYEMVKFPLGIPGTDVVMTFEWQVGEATPSQDIYITEYDHTTTLTLASKLYAAFTDFFHTLPTSPILYIGMDNFTYKLLTGLWSGHFNLNNTGQIHVNPNATSETLMFSDSPDGLSTGQSSLDYTSELWTGAEIAGNGNGILVSSGTAGRTQEALLLTFADGYTGTGADKAYTRVRLVLRYAAGAQDLILGLHPTSSSGATAYTFSIPGTPASTTPYPAETHTFDIDVSSFGITVGSFPALHVTLGNGAGGGFYLFEWTIAFFE